MTVAVVPETSPALVPSVLLAPTGQHTRYMLATYLRHVFIVTGALLAIALTIDLFPQLQKIEASAQGTGTLGAIWAVIRFSGLRAPDLIIPFMPFATFLGVLWAEVVLTDSRERMLVWNSGRSPLQCLAPVFALGIILGVLDFGMDAFLRPAAMAVQMREHLGVRGELFDRSHTADASWIALDRGRTGLLRARIVFGPPVGLRDVAYYKFVEGQLVEVDTAAFATPSPEGGTWQLHSGLLWKAPVSNDSNGVHFTIGTSVEAQTPFKQRAVLLNLDRLWLKDYGIFAHYLPFEDLVSLANTRSPAFQPDLYQTRLQVKLSELFLPGEMALLASCLAMLNLAFVTSARPIILTLLGGYLAHFGTKATLLMGENQYMNAFVAGWLVPLALAIAIWRVLQQIQRMRGPKDLWEHTSATEDTVADDAGDGAIPLAHTEAAGRA